MDALLLVTWSKKMTGIHQLLLSNFQISSGDGIEYLIIAGGGGGGSHVGAGGGAGGYRCSVPGENTGGGGNAEAQLSLLSGVSYEISIGDGGRGGQVGGYSPRDRGELGGDSFISAAGITTITSFGGGGGAGNDIDGTGDEIIMSSTNRHGGADAGDRGNSGSDGGSGGGGQTYGAGATTASETFAFGGFARTPTQGTNGGQGRKSGPYASGGGGGAGASPPSTFDALADNPTKRASNIAGGAGLSSSITGSAVTRAGGGAGCSSPLLGNTGSGGGGGYGNTLNGVANSLNAHTATGSGGAGIHPNNDAGTGGDGIVIIRSKTEASSATVTASTSGDYYIYSFTAAGRIAWD